VRIDLPVDANLPPEYIGSDRLRLEGYRRLAAAQDEAAIVGVVEELVDRYGPLPEPALLLVAAARLRLLCRQYGVTEVTASATTIRVTPLTLLDSQQMRLKRMYPSATYRATTSTITIPIPRAEGGIGAPRVRDAEMLRVVAGLLLALDGRPQTDFEVVDVGGAVS